MSSEITTERRALRPGRSDIRGRARWLAARGQNAARRRTTMAIVGTVVFLATLVLLVLLPGASTSMRAGLVLREGLQDTIPLLQALQRTTREFTIADSLLREIRARVAAPPQPASVQLSPQQRWKRDSLAAVASALGRMIARVQNSPLPQTYRALGESPLLRNDERVRLLLDSLDALEKEREAFGAVGGVDPMFVALTSRATAVGRAIQGIAEARRAEARDAMNLILLQAQDSLRLAAQLARDSAAAAAVRARDSLLALGLSPDAVPLPTAGVPAVDTMPFRARLDTAAVLRERAASALAVARTVNADVERRAQEARAEANTLAPPLAMLVASLLIGLMVGYGASLLLEMIRPTVAHAAEAERITGARVLGTVRPGERADERDRRRMDLLAPPEIAPGSRVYRAIYLHLMARGSAARSLCIVGDDPAVSAAVAANVAFLSASEGRNTLLVDTDTVACAVSSVLAISPAPGTSEVLTGSASWSDVISTPTLGREHTLDVVPAGARALPSPERDRVGAARDELQRIARRYDLCITVAAEDWLDAPDAAPVPAEEVVLCVRAVGTHVKSLAGMRQRIRDVGLRLRGVVLWDGDEPAIRSRREQLPVTGQPRSRENQLETATL